MKLFIISLITLALIAVFCIFGFVSVTRTIDSMLKILSSADAIDESVPQDTADACDRLREIWDKRSFLISMFLPHGHLDDVKEKLVTLTAYADTDEFAEWQDAKLVLEEELRHIRGLIELSSDNVL